MKSQYIEPEIMTILAQATDYVTSLALLTCLETGLRVNDVLNMKRGQLKGTTISGIEQKTRKPYKKRISPQLAKRLRQYRPQASEESWLFPSYKDPRKHIHRSTVYRQLAAACRRRGIKTRVTPHSTRKIYAVKIAEEKGQDAAQKELQHDRKSTTEIYTMSKALVEYETSKQLIGSEQFAEAIAEQVYKKLVELISK